MSRLLPANRLAAEEARAMRADMPKLDPNELYVVWGSAFPLVPATALLSSNGAERQLRLYGLGVLTLMPYAAAQWSRTPWTGLVERLTTGTPVPFIARSSQLTLLERYCEEHHHRKMRVTRVEHYKLFNVQHATCAAL
jgi:hypothetical protein